MEGLGITDLSMLPDEEGLGIYVGITRYHGVSRIYQCYQLLDEGEDLCRDMEGLGITEDLCRDMEGLGITDLSMLPDEGENLCRNMEGIEGDQGYGGVEYHGSISVTR